MATDNNSQINSFAAGLDGDSSIDRVGEGSYLMALNLRLIQYDKGQKNGSIAPIQGIWEVGKEYNQYVYKVLAAGSIRDYGIIVYISKANPDEPQLRVARFKNAIGGDKDTDIDYNSVSLDVIFSSKLIDWPQDESEWPNAVSIAFKYEDDDNIKLYIATSFNPILVLNIVKVYDSDYDIDSVSSYPSVMFDKPKFNKYITGAMNPGMVSYSYQLYNDYGVSTDISPACQQIPVINTDKSVSTDVLAAKGQEYGKKSSCGIQIIIPNLCAMNDALKKKFDRVKIYRITVHQNGQIPTVEVIYDSIFTKLGGDFTYNDIGQEPVQTISIEEYNSMSGIHVIPNSIESKDQMLFAANITEKSTFIDTDEFKNWDARAYRRNSDNEIFITDATQNGGRYYTDPSEIKVYTNGKYDGIYKKDAFNPYNDINKQVPDMSYLHVCRYDKDGYIGGDGVNVSWRFILTYTPIDTCDVDDSGTLPIGTEWNVLRLTSGIETPKCFFIHKSRGLIQTDLQISDEPGRVKESWLTKSLRRNELYRYGIILYDKTGSPSPVKWICDIRTPNLYENHFNTFISHYKASNGKTYDLASLPLGIAFNVRNLPSGCTGYEIVRCNRGEKDIATVSQGVISKPIVKYMNPSTPLAKSNVYYPTGLLTTAMVAQGVMFEYFWNKDYDPNLGKNCVNAAKTCATNFGNDKILQFISPEIVYQPESMKSIFKNKDYRLEPVRYLFGSSAIKLDSPYLSQKGKNLYRYYMRPGISNANLFTMPGTANGASEKWRYYYLTSSGETKSKEYIADPFILKMETQSLWSTYYKPSPIVYQTNWSNTNNIAVAMRIIRLATNKKYWGYTKAGKISDPVLSEKRYHVSPYTFAYIKLYEQADELKCVRTKQDDSFLQYGLEATSLDQNSKAPAVNNIEIATDLQWDQVIKMTFQEKGTNTSTKDAGRWWPKLEYKDHIDSVGQYQFCNAVMYGTDGALVDKGGELGDDGWTYAKDLIEGANDADPMIGYDFPTIDGKYHTLCSPYAAGGRCAVLQLDEDDYKTTGAKFTNILGATSYYVNSNNNLVSKTDLCKYNGVNIESIAGTVLCNLRKNVTPYNGYSSEARESNVYYSTGQYFQQDSKDNDTWNAVFDGDVTISVLDYTAMHKAVCTLMKDADADKYKNMNEYRTNSMMVGYAIPVESSINCRLSNGTEFSRESLGEGASLIQIQPANIENMYSQTDPEYAYNTAYATEDKVRVHAAFDAANMADFNKTVDYRIRNSNLKENNEHIDSWTKYQSSNFIDVDTQYGPITGLRDFKHQLMFWQQKAFGTASVNERSIATDDNGNSIILGNGGVLSRYDYLDTTAGMHEQEFCDTQSETTLYWYDHHNNEIRAYSGGQEISLTKKFLVQSIMEANRAKEQAPKLFFDSSYNEIVSKVLFDNWSISYNENVNKFISLYNIKFDESITFPNGTYLIKGDNNLHVAQWNCTGDDAFQRTKTWDNTLSTVYLEYAVNKYPTTTKVFDNQEIVTPQDESAQYHNYLNIDKRAYFSRGHQYWWSTETQIARDSLEEQMTQREHNYRYAIPRQYESGLYGSRMRGKYLICHMENQEGANTNIAIQYIITKFRTSWS